MARGDILVGLDIGTTKIATVVAEVGATPAELQILGVGLARSTGIRRGVVVDIEQTAQAIRESVAQAQSGAGVEVHNVVVGVTGEHIASLNSRGVIAVTNSDREVRAEDVERVLENARVIVLPPDREIIHVVSRGYSLDGQQEIRNPVGMSGTRLEVETHIVTGATTFLQNVARCVERANLRVDDVVLEPLATASATLLPAERNLGVALLDIGGGTSDLALFVEGEVCHTAVISVGGEYVTRDIAVCLRTDLVEAERIKREHGAAFLSDAPDDPTATFSFLPLGATEPTSESVALLNEIIEARMAELFQMVRREIDRSHYDAMIPAGLVVSGGGALLRGTATLARRETHLPTRLGVPSGLNFGQNVRPDLADLVRQPSFATGVGLVLWANRAHADARAASPFFASVAGAGNVGLWEAIRTWIRRTWTGFPHG